jgi:2-methylisocitrate lyase-like PEP mutase family enzyme
METTSKRHKKFRQLHQRGCFALPNPWDIGTARYLQHLGFKALATTSAGFAFSRGLPDGSVSLDDMLAHIREIVEATDLPVNADFENGYGDDPADVGKNVRRCIETGVSGISIEDTKGHAGPDSLYGVSRAVERMRAAREAVSETDVMLIGRAEGFLVGETNIEEIIRRLNAYSAAGADCLYAPGVNKREHISAIVAAVAPKPVNVLVGAAGGLTMDDAAALGVRRVSVGGGLARVAWGGFIRAAMQLARSGRFDEFAIAMPHVELQEFFSTQSSSRAKPRDPVAQS